MEEEITLLNIIKTDQMECIIIHAQEKVPRDEETFRLAFVEDQ